MNKYSPEEGLALRVADTFTASDAPILPAAGYCEVAEIVTGLNVVSKIDKSLFAVAFSPTMKV